MIDKDLLSDLDDIVVKLKARIIYYQTENKELKLKINQLKQYIGKL